MNEALIGVFGALFGVIASGVFVYVVHRENLRDQRLKERLDRIYEAQEALHRAYDLTLHAVYMTFEQPGTYHEHAMTALPDVGRFLALYNRLHIPEGADIGDQFYEAVAGLLHAARTNSEQEKDVFAPQVETSAEAIGVQLIRLAKGTEDDRARGWFSRLWKARTDRTPPPKLTTAPE